MANIRLIFQGTEESHTDRTDLQCYVNTVNEIFIEIHELDERPSHICLDKSTAIRLAKTLRTEINKIQ